MPVGREAANDVFGAELASFQPPAGGPWRLNMLVNLDNGARILGYATVTVTSFMIRPGGRSGIRDVSSSREKLVPDADGLVCWRGPPVASE